MPSPDNSVHDLVVAYASAVEYVTLSLENRIWAPVPIPLPASVALRVSVTAVVVVY